MLVTKRSVLKLTLLGEGAVGKSSFKQRFLTGEFTSQYIGTIGVDFATHQMELDGSPVKISIWDLAGQKHFAAIRIGFFRGSAGGVLMFDVTRPETLDGLYKDWVIPFWSSVGRKVPLVVVGNKTDLVELRQVSSEHGQEFAQRLGEESGFWVPYVETSVKEGINVSDSVERLVRQVLQASY